MNTTTFLNDYELSGEALKIFKYPAPVLKKVAPPVEDYNQELADLVQNMLYTMYKAPGIGLAAPQVGSSLRLFCIDTDFERERITTADGEDIRYSNFNPKVFINPEIIEKSGETTYQEGCLSFPGIFEDVKRFEKILVKYNDLQGKEHSLEAEGIQAICIQHELDHLDGIVFLERLSPLKRNFLLKKFKKKKKKKGFM